MTTQNKIEIGSLIHATLRPQDLIPCFLDAVREYAPAEYEQMMTPAFGPIPAYVQDEGDSCEWWQSDDASYLLEDLFNILEGVAPDGFYFGAHEGDGSDFGFWPLSEWSVSNVEGAKHLGILEVNGEAFEVLATDTKLVFGSACNVGFLESGYILREDCESIDETLQELHADLETYYREGASHVSRIVCNERM